MLKGSMHLLLYSIALGTLLLSPLDIYIPKPLYMFSMAVQNIQVLYSDPYKFSNPYNVLH